VVQIRNTTGEAWSLKIKLAAGQPLRAPTTFSGILRPGQVKVFYLYDGYEYEFRTALVEEGGPTHLQSLRVGSDLGLVFAGDSLAADENPLVLVGRPLAITDHRAVIRHRYGEPDRRIARTLEPEPEDDNLADRTLQTGFALPYEVWTYFDTGYRYVFLDELRSGNFALVTSTDPTEPGRPGWEERLSRTAVEQIQRE
jgi:hypothetical protein